MEFILFTETNHKENETFWYYLQWTGNEQELTKLAEIIHQATPWDLDGDYAELRIDTTVRITEAVADQHLRLNGTHVDGNGYAPLFTKVKGKFTSPGTLEEVLDGISVESNTGYEIARWCDENFYSYSQVLAMFHDSTVVPK